MEQLQKAIAAMIAETKFAEAEHEARLRDKLLNIRQIGHKAIDSPEDHTPLQNKDVWGAEDPTAGNRRS